MCDCNLLVERSTGAPVPVSALPHRVIYHGDGEPVELLSNVLLSGTISYASVSELHNSHGLRHGYMILIGERT